MATNKVVKISPNSATEGEVIDTSLEASTLPGDFNFNLDTITVKKAIQLINTNRFKDYASTYRAMGVWGRNARGKVVYSARIELANLPFGVSVKITSEGDLVDLKRAVERNFERNGYNIDEMSQRMSESGQIDQITGVGKVVK